ncbi:MAG: hypothetical protein C4547_13900 [Phycisphaerales bacterium]|nr:MAG: hypothetical protein C4547_13900 [Phycisphaerales bacterium]
MRNAYNTCCPSAVLIGLLLAASAALGQDGEPLQLSASAGVASVALGGETAVTASVTGGTPPYTVTFAVDDENSTVVGAAVDVLEATGDGPEFDTLFSAPDDNVGVARIRVGVTDAVGANLETQVEITVTCPIRGLCSQFIREEDLVGAIGREEGAVARRLAQPNLSPPVILSALDIDGDGLVDNAPDTDGDGLPDSWETGGFESLDVGGNQPDRFVFFPAPSAIVPGTPPTPIFTRLAVSTSAFDPDTDGDGLSDFVEVFGLRFIDEDQDGRLAGDEWDDLTADGIPSPGEAPLDNSGESAGFALRHDFDGFVFTDPTNPDTDGDGINDSQDLDPLINIRAFGNTGSIIVRFNAEGDADIDDDGLGNAMDMGNDLVSTDGEGVQDFQVIDNPESVVDILDLFRRDLLAEVPPIVPESTIEDLLGVDWDGNGLWRTTDVREWSPVIDRSRPGTLPPAETFTIAGLENRELYAEQTFEQLRALYNGAGYDTYGEHGVGLGWQRLLEPAGRTEFMPDVRIWAILYAWRLPGFDIDGDGFIGVPNLPSTSARVGEAGPDRQFAAVGLRFDAARGRFLLADDVRSDVAEDDPLRGGRVERAFDDRIEIGQIAPQDPDLVLDGRIVAPDGFPTLFCGSTGAAMIGAMALGLVGLGRLRRSR